MKAEDKLEILELLSTIASSLNALLSPNYPDLLSSVTELEADINDSVEAIKKEVAHEN